MAPHSSRRRLRAGILPLPPFFLSWPHHIHTCMYKKGPRLMDANINRHPPHDLLPPILPHNHPADPRSTRPHPPLRRRARARDPDRTAHRHPPARARRRQDPAAVLLAIPAAAGPRRRRGLPRLAQQRPLGRGRGRRRRGRERRERRRPRSGVGPVHGEDTPAQDVVQGRRGGLLGELDHQGHGGGAQDGER